MTSEHRSAAGPYIEYDDLPVLHATEEDLPLLRRYGTVEVGGRHVTPGGGRLTVRMDGKHLQITLDHLGCPAQLTDEKTPLFRRLGLAAEGHCPARSGAVTTSPTPGRCCAPSRCGLSASTSQRSYGPRSPSNSATSAPSTCS
ncbi:DUF6420 family protein [Streptomyces sp. TRM70308]|uniref:DUF6420 family protein n=1 Tax=Streptomyces sp. TRM70308 TaxID=3131932 RepID=UPI003D05E6BF